ncbi:MAG TPA: acyl-CoA desaturase [Hyphomonas sp.]|nr:acyl-CoA desaturase [Hyphomonas sp.]
MAEEMNFVRGPETIIPSATSSPVEGIVRWSASKSLWISGMTLAGIAGGAATASWDAVLVFLALTGATLCAGHSVGMHRLLIHKSFEAPRWLERLLVWAGTLVGMAGPIGMMRQHDLRDWAQRQKDCHPYLCHRSSFWKDAWWQLHCDLVLARPPSFDPSRATRDPFHYFLERTWMAQQIVPAAILFALGGWAFVFWGMCLRVAVSVTGHWLVGHYAHREGHQSYVVDGAAVQGFNVSIAGLISMGESWHNNHHAFPGSARLGLDPGQADAGFWFIRALEYLGLARNIVLPEHLPTRPALRRTGKDGGGCPLLMRLQHAMKGKDKGTTASGPPKGQRIVPERRNFGLPITRGMQPSTPTA